MKKQFNKMVQKTKEELKSIYLDVKENFLESHLSQSQIKERKASLSATPIIY